MWFIRRANILLKICFYFIFKTFQKMTWDKARKKTALKNVGKKCAFILEGFFFIFYFFFFPFALCLETVRDLAYKMCCVCYLYIWDLSWEQFVSDVNVSAFWCSVAFRELLYSYFLLFILFYWSVKRQIGVWFSE